MKISLVLIFIIALCIPGHPFEKNTTWNSGDRLHILAFSPDSKFMAVKKIFTAEGLGGTEASLVMVIDIEHKALVKKHITSYFCYLPNPYVNHEAPDAPEKMAKVIEKLETEARQSLTKSNITLEARPAAFPRDLSLAYENKIKGEQQTQEFFIKDAYFGNTYPLMTTTHRLNGDPGLTPGKIYATPDMRSFFVFYHRPPVMEFDPGTAILITANRFRLASIYNAIGHNYYKAKELKTAKKFFLRAVGYDDGNLPALYNAACMCGLEANASEALLYLNKIRAFNTAESRQWMSKARNDRDFDRVKDAPALKLFFK